MPILISAALVNVSSANLALWFGIGALLQVLVPGVFQSVAFSRQLKALAKSRPPGADLSDEGVTSEQLVVSGTLMFSGPQWRQRSVRKIEFLSPNAIRAGYSLDFVIPDATPAGSTVFVPLLLIGKTKLAGLDLCDESGASVPMLNIQDEQRLTSLLLLALWGQFFPDTPIEPGSDAERQLYSVVREDGEDAALVELYELAISLDRLRAPVVCLDAGTRPYDPEPLFREFAGVVEHFVSNGYLFAVLQDVHPGQRRIIKLSFDTQAPWQYPSVWRIASTFSRRILGPYERRALGRLARVSANAASLRAAGRGRVLLESSGVRRAYRDRTGPFAGLAMDLWAGFRASLSRIGLTSRRYESGFSPFRARSEHLEILAPPGTYISGGTLFADRGTPTEKVLDRATRGGFRAHFYSTDADPTDREFVVRIRALRRGWLLSALLTSSTITALLAFAWARRSELDAAEGFGAAITAIALGIGTIAVVYLVRPGEHPMTTRLLEGPRLGVLLAGLSALVAIMLLSTGTPSNGATGVERAAFADHGAWALGASALGTLIIAANYVGSAIGWLRTLDERLDRHSLRAG